MPEATSRARIYDLIDAERENQQYKWGRDHEWGHGDCSSRKVPDIVKAVVLGEECGEVQRAVLDHDAEQLRRELIQVAAVAVAWLEVAGPRPRSVRPECGTESAYQWHRHRGEMQDEACLEGHKKHNQARRRNGAG